MNASFLWATPHFVPDPSAVTEKTKWELIRLHRNFLLTRCDWTQLPDASLTQEEKQSWASYRQTLRDIPEDFTAPDEVVFPAEPGAA